MDLSDLHIFRTVVAEGGITRAARKLLRVQSSITTRVRQLEDDLGVELFIREGKRMHVSPAGQILLGYADRLLSLAEEAREAVHDVTPRGRFRLGSMESTAAVRLPVPLSAYHQKYPEVEIELRTGNPQELARAVHDGDVDAALVAEPIAGDPFEKTSIYVEELVLISGLGRPPIRSPADVKKDALLVFEPGCPQRARLEDWFASHGELPERIVEMGSYHAMFGCVIAGMGISLMPKAMLDAFPDKDQVGVHALPKKISTADTVLIWRKGARSPKIDVLIELLNVPG